MHLQEKDIQDIGHILARRHFSEQGWKYTDLMISTRKIIESVEIVNEQYSKYPYMNKDWYVENSAEKTVHMAANWKQLNYLVGLLQTCPDQFHFLLKLDTQRSLCMVKTGPSDLDSKQENAIAEARKAGYNVLIFITRIPDTMDFELEQVIGGITGRGNFRKEEVTL